MSQSLYRILYVAGSLAASSFTHAADQTKSDDAKSSATPPAASSVSRPARGVEKIDINTADASALKVLPGVDEKTAAAIVAARPFKSVEDIARVPGIGDARMEILKEQITVSKSEDQPEPTGRATARSGEPDAASATKVDLNSATLEELAAVPEIGPDKAQAIIAARPFKSADDVKRVKDVDFDAIKDRVTVGSAATTK